jgi:hypothetical protein
MVKPKNPISIMVTRIIAASRAGPSVRTKATRPSTGIFLDRIRSFPQPGGHCSPPGKICPVYGFYLVNAVPREKIEEPVMPLNLGMTGMSYAMGIDRQVSSDRAFADYSAH